MRGSTATREVQTVSESSPSGAQTPTQPVTLDSQAEKRRKYRQFCEGRQDIPVFSQPWWLDAVCGQDAWDVCLVEGARGIIGALPFASRTRFGFRFIAMPPLTQNLKVWINYTDSVKAESRLSMEKAVITAIIRDLPPFDSFSLNTYRSLSNWLPFYWQGFSQTTRYTYVLEDLGDLAAVFASFSHAKRKNIKRAESLLKPGPELAAREFFDHHAMTLRKEGKEIFYQYPLLERIFQAARERDSGKVFSAVDSEGKIYAAIFVVWDPLQAYYLISSIDPEHRSSGAATYLIQQAIRRVSAKTKRFDFEGSMNEGIENSFRQFGTTQVPYFQLCKGPSMRLKLALALHKLLPF